MVNDDSTGLPAARRMQLQEMFQGAFLFDAKAKYRLYATVANGDDFAGGWSNSGLGSSPASYRVYMKQIFLSARPVTGLEVQYGGLGMQLGNSSAITSYATNGYLVGGRILLQRPSALFFDTIAYTKAYLGDLKSPQIFNRFRRLGQTNYQQFLLAKQIGRRTSASVDYTNQWGIKTMREGAHFQVPEWKVLDGLQFDLYQRTNGIRANGFHLGGEKAVTRRFSMSGGYVSIDRYQLDLNNDAFFHGKRVYASAKLQVTKSLSVSTLVNRAAGNNYAVPNRTHFNLACNYDLLSALEKTGLVGDKP